MPINFDQLKSSLKQLEKRIPKDKIEAAGASAVTKLKAATGSSLGNIVGELKGGFQSLSQSADIQALQEAAAEFAAEVQPIAEEFAVEAEAIFSEIEPELRAAGQSIQQALESITTDVRRASTQLQEAARPAAEQLQAIAEKIIESPTIARITETVPGLAAKLVQDISSEKTGLGKLIGDDVDNGFLEAGVGAGSPTAISALLRNVGATLEETKGAMEAVLTPEVRQELEDIGASIEKEFVTDESGALAQLTSEFENVSKEVEKSLSGPEATGAFGKLQGIIESQTGDIKNILKNGLGSGLSTDGLKSAIGKITEGDTEGVVKDLTLVTPGKTAAEIKTTVESIDTSVTTSAPKPQLPIVLPETKVLKGTSGGWEGLARLSATDINIYNDIALVNNFFTYVTTKEESEVDLANIEREVTELIIDHTATYSDQDLDAVGINSLIFSRNQQLMPYHYIIRKNGTMQRGRPKEELTTSLFGNGHDKLSLTIAFVGGLKGPRPSSGVESYETKLEKASWEGITPKQLQSLKFFLGGFYAAYPGGQVITRGDITSPNSVTGDIPLGINKPDFLPFILLNWFGKSNLPIDLTQGPKTTAELVQISSRGTR
jgi:hypothetical protein